MNNFFREASDAGEVPYEGLTTPDTTITSPLLDTNRSPDSCFVYTTAHKDLPAVSEDNNPTSTFAGLLTQAMSPTDKVDSWFASTSARPNLSSTTRPDTRDSFVDSIPEGPSQLSATREQTPALLWKETETSSSPAERVQEHGRPRLILRIPFTTMGDENFQSAPQPATDPEILDPQAEAPHTTDSLIPAARPCTPEFQGPQRQATPRVEILNPAARPFQSKFAGARAPPHRSHRTVMPPTEPSYTNSKVWINNRLSSERQRWQRVEDNFKSMNLLRSCVVPNTFKDWLAHQRGRADAKKTREQQKLDMLVPYPRDPRLPPPGHLIKNGPAFRGRSFEHKNYCAILPFPSVWARNYEPSTERPDALWPCVEEMKEEGDERNTSGFRRFPAIPRVPGNDTVQYKYRKMQDCFPFDEIWKLPTRDSVEAANERYLPEETEKMEEYLGTSLLDALDCITEDSL